MLLCFVVPCIRAHTQSLSHAHTHTMRSDARAVHASFGRGLPSFLLLSSCWFGCLPSGEPSRQTKQFENGWTVGALPGLPARWILCAPPLRPKKIFDRQSHRRIDAGFRKLGAVMPSVCLSVCLSCLHVMSADDGSQVSSPVPFLPPGVTSGLQVHFGRLVPQSFLTDLY